MAMLTINKVKCTKELNKVSWSGFVYIEESDLWMFRIAPEDEWITIPRGVFESKKGEIVRNADELVGRLFRYGYRVEAEMLLKQMMRTMMIIMHEQLNEMNKESK